MQSSLASWSTSVAESLFTALFPADCRLCGTPLINISRLPVCPECLSAIRPVGGGRCFICGERLISPHIVSGEGEPRCGLCRRLEPPFARASAYGSYAGGLRELIHLLKYERVQSAAAVLGRMLKEAVDPLRPAIADSPIVVTPVPLFATKLRQRGFNQSELIARSAVRLMPEESRLKLDARILQRCRDTRSQIGLSRQQRIENVRGAFVIVKPEAIANRNVLLVDDVFTTGTTISECARVLRRAGAVKVFVATVARTLKADGAYAEPEDAAEERMAVAAAG